MGLDLVALGHRLRRCRRARALGAGQVADLLGVTRVTLWRWERGARVPGLLDVVTLADMYGASVGWTVRGEGEPPTGLPPEDEDREEDEGEPLCQTG